MNSNPIPTTLPDEVRDAFTTSAINALREMMQIESYSTDNFTAETLKPAGRLVLAALRLARSQPGELRLVCSVELATHLVARYLGDEVELSSEMIDDLAGELANVIAGQAKTMLKGTDYHFLMTSPVVARVAVYTSVCPLSLIECEFGSLLLELQLEPCAGS